MTNLKRCSFLALLLVPMMLIGATTEPAASGKEPHKLNEKDTGGFSYDPPEGFEIATFEGLKYHISKGPSVNGFSPNIVVVDETYDGAQKDYVDLNMVNLKKAIPSVNIVSQDTIKSNDGQTASRAVVTDEQGGQKLRQTFYFFENGQHKYVMTCTALADGGDKLDAAFEASVKTFRIH